jgi:mono/diheme cytochrome c family protein/uncharacterized membrane protein
MNDSCRLGSGAGRIAPPWILACAIALAGQGEALANDRSAEESLEGLASQVQAIFAVKCAECHGATGRLPKGGFGNLTDLRRVASNPAIVVPFRPNESTLWLLVQAGEMPLQGSKGGPLTQTEKELIRNWIVAGAPAPPTSGQFPEIAPPDEEQPGEPQPLPLGRRFLRWVGKFHVLVIHFPIALLVAAAAGELWLACLGSRQPWPAVRFLVYLGAAGAVVAAICGWLHADFGGYGAGSAQVLRMHRWLGTIAGLWAVGLAFLCEAEARRRRRTGLFRVLLWVGTGLIGATAHLGGTLVHGEGFFTW